MPFSPPSQPLAKPQRRPIAPQSSQLGPTMPNFGPVANDDVLGITNLISLQDLVIYVRRFSKLAVIVATAVSVLLLFLLTGRTALYSSSTHVEVSIAEEGTWQPGQILENSAVFLVNNHKLALQTRAYQEFFYNNLDEQDRLDFLHDRGFRKPLAAKAIAQVKSAKEWIAEIVAGLLSNGEDGDSTDAERERFIKKLSESTIRIIDEKDSHILRIEANSPNRDLAASIANQYASLYANYLAESNRSKARARFEFLEQTEQAYRNQAIDSLKELNRFRVENEILDNSSKATAVNDEVKRLNEERARIRVAYTTAEGVLLQVGKAKKTGANLLSIMEIANAPAVAERAKTLAQKQQEYDAYLSLYGPNHVNVKQARHQVSALVNLLDANIAQTIKQFQNTKEGASARLEALENELKKVLNRVLDEDRKSLELANLVARAESDQKTYDEILAKLNQAKVEMEVPETSKIRVINTAVPADKPYRPNKPLSAIISAFAFVSIFLGLPLFLGLTDDLSRRYGFRIPHVHRNLPDEIAKIPAIEATNGMSMLADAFKPGPARDSMFKLANSIERAWLNEEQRTLIVTSAEEGEGKTFLSAALGGVFTSQGRKTLVIDCNLRAPAMSFWFPHLHGQANLVTWLESEGRTSFELEKLRHGDSNLFVLPAHGWATNPERLLTNPALSDLLAHASREFDVVILDTPQINGYADTPALVAQASKIIIASDSTLSNYGQLATAISALGDLPAEKVVGIVANRCVV